MILVTGGAGFIGANFVLDWLASHDEPVLNLDKLTYAGNRENIASLQGDARHLFVQGDIGDAALTARLLAQHQPRAIVNFAAESHVDRSIHGPADFIQTNIVGTFALLESVRAWWNGLQGDARAAFRFLHVSTDEVYGSLAAADPAFTETHPYEPNSPYSASEQVAERFGPDANEGGHGREVSTMAAGAGQAAHREKGPGRFRRAEGGRLVGERQPGGP